MVPIPADTPALPERHRALREKAIAKLRGIAAKLTDERDYAAAEKIHGVIRGMRY